MTEKTHRKIRIEWIRSGIGFPYLAKEMVRSLGLRRLHQVVERPDSPQVRGLVARVAHLVRIVEKPAVSPWGAVPEYTIAPGEAKPAPRPRAAKVAVEPVAVASAAAEATAAPAAKGHKAAKAAKAQAAPAKAKKQAKPEKGREAKARESKGKPAAAKRAKPAGKGKK